MPKASAATSRPSRLRAPVPRPHGPAGGRPRRRRAAGDRDRPDQPGAHLALDGRHDDRAERPPEAAVRARRRSCSTGRPRCAVRHDTPETIYAELMARAAADGDPRLVRHLPGRAAGRHHAPRSWSSGWRPAASRACRPSAKWPRRPARARCSTWWPTASACSGAEKVARDRGDRARAQARQRAASTSTCWRRGRRARAVALLHRPALPRERHPLRRPAAGDVLASTRALRRLRDLPRLRPRDRRRLRPGDPRRRARRCAPARSSRCRRRPGRNARTT